jgi:hypothetical protein
MYVKIIFNGAEGRFDIPAFIVTDNECLNISFALPKRQNCVYLAIISNGKESKRVTMATNYTVSLPPEWLKRCNGYITIDLDLRDRSRSVVYQKYKIEPLAVTVGDNQVEATAYLQDLEMRVQVCEMKIMALEAFVRSVPMLLEETKKEAVIESAGGDPMGA